MTEHQVPRRVSPLEQLLKRLHVARTREYPGFRRAARTADGTSASICIMTWPPLSWRISPTRAV